ncbi:hypothetical protein VPH35_001961 [Triticum aestivum]
MPWMGAPTGELPSCRIRHLGPPLRPANSWSASKKPVAPPRRLLVPCMRFPVPPLLRSNREVETPLPHVNRAAARSFLLPLPSSSPEQAAAAKSLAPPLLPCSRSNEQAAMDTDAWSSKSTVALIRSLFLGSGRIPPCLRRLPLVPSAAGHLLLDRRGSPRCCVPLPRPGPRAFASSARVDQRPPFIKSSPAATCARPSALAGHCSTDLGHGPWLRFHSGVVRIRSTTSACLLHGLVLPCGISGAEDTSAGDATKLKLEFDEDLGRYYVSFPDDQ